MAPSQVNVINHPTVPYKYESCWYYHTVLVWVGTGTGTDIVSEQAPWPHSSDENECTTVLDYCTVFVRSCNYKGKQLSFDSVQEPKR